MESVRKETKIKYKEKKSYILCESLSEFPSLQFAKISKKRKTTKLRRITVIA